MESFLRVFLGLILRRVFEGILRFNFEVMFQGLFWFKFVVMFLRHMVCGVFEDFLI